MADSGVKISGLPTAESAADADVVAGVQSNTTKKFPLSVIASYIVGKVTPAGIGAVPTSRTVNSKALSADISLSASDVGAIPSTDKGVASGVASLDSSGKVPSSQLPASGASVLGGTISFSTTWTDNGDGTYSQTVTVTGASVTSDSLISMQPTPAQLAQLMSDGVTALVITNNAGTLTATALSAEPTTAMTIACTVTEVS